MTEQNKETNEVSRNNVINFSREDFARLVITDLSGNVGGRGLLKKYTQSEVREIVENFKIERNQERLREISVLLWAKSPQYQRLLKYFAGMATFAHVIAPIKDLRTLNNKKVQKQYVEIGELLKLMSLRHEMTKVLNVAFREDIFYGYVHKDKRSFYIQQMPPSICKATSVEDGVFNYSIDMTHIQSQDNKGKLHVWAKEIQIKYLEWKSMRERNPKISQWVELDAKNTICIKVNEDMLEPFPPFAGVFDSIFDIEAFKDLRKDREKLGNYMVLTQKLPMRQDSENNNDFMIDKEFMMFFHNQASDVVPDNVGVITSPMDIKPINFQQDKVDRDGVAKATRDFWEDGGTSQLLFSSSNTSSAGLGMSIKSDEEMVFALLTQIERWLNRYLKGQFGDLMFNVSILPVTRYNQDEMHKMYLESAQYGVPVKSHLSATVGLDPIEVMNMSYLENDMLKMHEEWIPLMSSHTMSDSVEGTNSSDGAPKKKDKEISDETSRDRDKPNSDANAK
ncbi:hypothetical protein NUG13_11570 [Bacillus subtilis]|uniref:hypothetical protein n=1 Tax=Bacillus subtilis TaxID=1423 RepID=UPI00214FF288|nr:hypothetical protein [Bacillus subtilis]MCR4361965.1 hypothetical protein [Bacillus subtilis]